MEVRRDEGTCPRSPGRESTRGKPQAYETKQIGAPGLSQISTEAWGSLGAGTIREGIGADV